MPVAIKNPDVTIAGAGIIGLSLALELHRRGARVTVLETGFAMGQASTAAAGMLAAEDPHNPAALLPLSRFSLSLYPGFLRSIEALSGLGVPFQTDTTIQRLPGGHLLRLDEQSLDPRQLAIALLQAVRSTSIDLREHVHGFRPTPKGLFVHCNGAWFQHSGIVRPRKGQMLRVRLPVDVPLHEVHRSERAYVVPRTQGPQAGTAIIGATLEDVGFDIHTHASDLDHLRDLVAEMVPGLASAFSAPQVEAWSGLRPGTTDDLPLLGALSSHELVATGHFRNGILLAPGTAHALADLIEGKQLPLSLAPFSPHRFADIRPQQSDKHLPALR